MGVLTSCGGSGGHQVSNPSSGNGKDTENGTSNSNGDLVSITISPATVKIARGTTTKFKATGVYSDGSTQDLTTSVVWSSQDEHVAKISNSPDKIATITTVAAGATHIKATSGAIAGKAELTVTSASLKSITVLPSNMSVALGLSQQFTARGTFSDSSVQDISSSVTWSSSRTSVATITNEGLADSVATGSATIRAALGSISNTTPFAVTAAELSAVELTPSTLNIPLGASQQFTATGIYTNGATQDLTSVATWSSSATSNATISNITGTKGLAHTVAAGTTTITVTYGLLSDSMLLTVSAAALASLEITPSKHSIALGFAQQFTATGVYTDGSKVDLTTEVSWTSSDEDILPHTTLFLTTGLAEPVNTGTVAVTAASGDVSGSASLEVTSATLTSIEITPTDSNLALGFNRQLTAIGIFSDNTTQDLTSIVSWSSSDENIAIVDDGIRAKGEVSSVNTGSAEITATYDHLSASAHVTVTSATLLSLSLTPINSHLPSGLTQQMTAIGVYSDGSTQDLTNSVSWHSSDEDIAQISRSGLVTSASGGTVTITAESSAISATTELTVTSAVLQSLAVTPNTASLPLGYSQQFTATGTYSDNSTRDLTSTVIWSSSDITKAIISNASGSEGFASSVDTGAATLTATSGTITGSASLTVTSATLQSLSITPVNPSLADGFASQFYVVGTFSDQSTADLTSLVTWSSLDTSVASISNASGSNGLVLALNTGSTVLTASYHGISDNTTLTVTSATLQSIDITPDSESIPVGISQAFTATGIFSDGSTQDLTKNVSWTSSDSSKVAISNSAGSQGIAETLSIGTTTLTATMNGVSGSTNLTITAATLISLDISSTSSTVPAGLTAQYTATGLYSDGSSQDLTDSVLWTSSSQSTAIISNVSPYKGLTSTKSAGTTTITATYESRSATATLTVSNALLQTLTITPTTSSIPQGLTQQFTAVGSYSDSSLQDVTTSVTWSTSSTTVATISNSAGSQGLATGKTNGTSTITASLGGTSANATLTVTTATLQSITISPATTTLGIGMTQQYIATGNYSDSSTQNLTNSVTWYSSNASVASISNASRTKGVLTTKASGTATVTATFSGISGTSNLTVTAATLVSIAVTPANQNVSASGSGGVGPTLQLTATATFSDSSTLDVTQTASWSSSKSSWCRVDNSTQKGLITVRLTNKTVTITAQIGAVSGNTTVRTKP